MDAAGKIAERRITDVHAHIIPGLDDGAPDLEQALQMAKIAQRQGICHIIATPHTLYEGTYIFSDSIREAMDSFQRELRNREIPITLSAGQEIFYFDGAVDYLKSGKFCTLASSFYILVEFLPIISWKECYQAMRRLRQSGYWPIIAHAERYDCLRNEMHLEELKELGVYLQINFSSFAGKLWDKDIRWCRKMILDERIDFLGTDMHSAVWRSPDVRKELTWLEKKVPSSLLEKILWENPQKILLGKRLEEEEGE